MYYTANELGQLIKKKSSYLCVGLDPDNEKIPRHFFSSREPVYDFCREIIDNTHDLALAFKPNLAFFEALGPSGLETFQKVCDYIPDENFVIADAKRGDIGNTARMYARSLFENYKVDAVTVNPYMGNDTLEPFLEFENKYTIVLGLTSNPGSGDFQKRELTGGNSVFEEVIEKVQEIGDRDHLMFVVGATQDQSIRGIREQAAECFFLVPGIGSQGGDLESISINGFNSNVGLIVNSSRSILYASSDRSFASDSRRAASDLRDQMKSLLDRMG